MSQIGFIFPNFQGENKKQLKPPTMQHLHQPYTSKHTTGFRHPWAETRPHHFRPRSPWSCQPQLEDIFVCLFVCLEWGRGALATCKYQGKHMRKTNGQEWTGMSFQPTFGKETKRPKEWKHINCSTNSLWTNKKGEYDWNSFNTTSNLIEKQPKLIFNTTANFNW